MAGRLGVVGAGLMGSGIAQVAAQAGWTVTMRDVDAPAVERGLDGIRASLGRFVHKGQLSAEDAEAALGRIETTTDLEALSESDLVVEAVFERLEAKHEEFRAPDRICKDTAGRATHTLVIPGRLITPGTQRAHRVTGKHLSSPRP